MQPAERITPPDWMRDPATQNLLLALGAGGAKARFVGGCVRDAVLGAPASDIDLATPEAPELVLKRLHDAGIRAVPTGLAHGTVTAVIGHRHFEITTLRKDVETDGRRARVEFTDDWLQDALRRDFTINALYADADGTIYDPTGGLADLAQAKVRFVGNAGERIEEDALRILRYFRFLARFGRGDPDDEALRACRDKRTKLAILSGERIAGEILGLLALPDPLPALKRMEQLGILDELFQTGLRLDRLGRLLGLEKENAAIDAGLRLAVLLPSSFEIVDRLTERLRLSNADRERMLAAATPAKLIREGLDDKMIRKALFHLGRDRFADQVWLAAADRRLKSADEILQLASRLERPSFELKGSDVLALGAAPGPKVGQLLREVEDWWEAGDFAADRAGCLAELRQRYAAKQSKKP